MKRKGFTLIEVVIIICMIAILLLLLCPALYSLAIELDKSNKFSNPPFKQGQVIHNKESNVKGTFLQFDYKEKCYKVRVRTDDNSHIECWYPVEIQEYPQDRLQ